MRDDWTLMETEKALAVIRGHKMRILAFSCDRYKYFSPFRHPLIKQDRRRREFFYNPDYMEFIKNNP